MVGSALTDASVAVPHGHYASATMATTVVPNRNAVFLSVATAVAVAGGAGGVAIAVHAGDHPVYPDCRPAFIDAFEHMARVTTRASCVAPTSGDAAPFLAMTKPDIVAAGARLGVPFAETWSCEAAASPRGCAARAQRRQAFVFADVVDPTRTMRETPGLRPPAL